MRTTWNLLRAELSAHAVALRNFAIVAAIITAANLALGGAMPAVAVCTLTTAFLPGALFAQDERAHLDAMYAILPVTRTQFVLGRYLLVALVAAATTLAGVGVARVDSLVRGPQAGPVPLSTAAVAGVALAVVGAVAAVQLPLFLALGHARTGVLSYGATMALMFGVILLVRRLPGLAATLLDWAGRPFIGPAGLGVAAALLVASAACATRLSRRRSL